MCQVDEEYTGLGYNQDKIPLSTLKKKCVKCKEETAVIIIRVSDAFCRSCFREYFIHKYRAMLGKNRIIFPEEKVLLAVSGGPASCAMLSQVREGLSRDAPKKLRFVPGIIYIDDGGACGLSAEERESFVAQLKSIFSETGYPYFTVPLEQVFSLPTTVLVPGSSSAHSYKQAVDQYIREKQTNWELTKEDTAGTVTQLSMEDSLWTLPDHKLALERLFSSLKTLTAKKEMLQILRQHLILYMARVNGYTKVMMGDSCSCLAVRMLSNIALGRGAALPSDTGFSDLRYGDVVIVRPMRDYSSNEIAFYNRMFNVPSVFTSGVETKESYRCLYFHTSLINRLVTWTMSMIVTELNLAVQKKSRPITDLHHRNIFGEMCVKTHDKASIQQLTESFVNNLQADFPSTVSTIYRTSEKLHAVKPSQSQTTEPASKCMLCLCAIDTKGDKASAFHATLVSERLSQLRLTDTFQGAKSAENCCAAGQGRGIEGCCSSSNRLPAYENLKALLCYSCRLTIKDMGTVNDLPPYIITEAEKRQKRSQMKMEISKFLLEDEDKDGE